MYFNTWKICWLATVLVEMKDNTNVNGQRCNEITIRNRKCMDCSHPHNRIQPKDDLLEELDSAIECLDISNTELTTRTENRIKSFLYLTHLVAVNVRLEHGVDSIFKPLVKLEYLNLTNSRYELFKDVTFPDGLKILDMTNIDTDRVGVLRNCHKLEVANFSNNKMLDMPLLSSLAPLNLVVLDGNPLKLFTLDRLALYCNVKVLSLNTDTSQIFKTTCQCAIFKRFAKEFNITLSNFDCESDNCTIPYDEKTLWNRHTCLEMQKKEGQWTIYIIIGAAITLVALLTLCLCCGIIYRATRQKNEFYEYEATPEEFVNYGEFGYIQA